VAEHVFQEADGLSIRLTCSIGVSTFPTHGTQPRALIEAADLAMYRAEVERDASAPLLIAAAPARGSRNAALTAPVALC
jgi:GGDEF domain-containing protein